MDSAVAKKLPEVHGNRRVRTPMYGGERLGWWRQTVNTSVQAADGACRTAKNTPCPHHRWPGQAVRGKARRGTQRRAHGRRLRTKKAARYDLDAPPLPGVGCMPTAASATSIEEIHEQLFSGYLQLQHVRRAEYGRSQRWMCSWLYKLRACDDAERAQLVPRAAAATAAAAAGRGEEDGVANRCRRIAPPDHSADGLGWRGHDVNALSDLGPLLYHFRCW